MTDEKRVENDSSALVPTSAKPVGKSRRGFPKFAENPSIKKAVASSRTGTKKLANRTGDRFMIVSESGEVMAPAGFHEVVEVDRTQFVKLYVAGVKAFQGLTNAGTKVFEMIYRIVQEHPGTDQIYLHFMQAGQMHMDVSERTFHRGLSELLEKEFIFESTAPNLYFLNVDYLFNGNRLAFIREYRVAEKTAQRKSILKGRDEQLTLAELDVFNHSAPVGAE